MSMLILLDLSAAAATIDHGCFWHVCSCLCQGPELHMTDLFSFSSLKGHRWQCLVIAHRPWGVSPCVWHQTALFCHPSFAATNSKRKDRTIHGRNKNIAQPLRLVWCPACLASGVWASYTSRKHRSSRRCQRPSSELQAQAKNTWGRHNNPNPQRCQRSFPICNSGKTQYEVTLQKASFDKSRCENGPVFLMGKAFKWQNL